MYLLTLLVYTARSPLYSHISATIQGISTIRAFKEHAEFLNKFHFYQNENTKGWYLKIALTRWFGLRIDLAGSFFLTFISFVSIVLADSEKTKHSIMHSNKLNVLQVLTQYWWDYQWCML